MRVLPAWGPALVMQPKTRRLIQLVLLSALVVAAVRLAVIFSSRRGRAPRPTTGQTARPGLPPEYYVTPKKLYLYDLKSTRQELSGKQVWVREGYRYTFYPYDAKVRRADFQHEAGQLGPIEGIGITGVVAQPAPGANRQQQVLALFEKDGKAYAVPVGAQLDRDYSFYANEMFFYEDPRQLYNFWPGEIWEAISNHQVRPGMNEFQVAFAIGMGVPEKGESDDRKIVRYPNGGKPLVITYRNGRAAEIQPGV